MPSSRKSKSRAWSPADIKWVADRLRTLSHPTRLRIVELLLRAKHTGGELAEQCSVTPAHAFTHLARMRNRGLLDSSTEVESGTMSSRRLLSRAFFIASANVLGLRRQACRRTLQEHRREAAVEFHDVESAIRREPCMGNG